MNAQLNNAYVNYVGNKYAGAICLLYTLDGQEEAHIEHAHDDHHAVIIGHRSGQQIYVNWQTVQRKMEADRLFYAC